MGSTARGLAGVALCLLAACQREATGQTVAVINGEEISQKELNDELQSTRIPEGADRQKVLPQVLQRVVDRKLLAQAAKEQGIDRSPEFLTRQRRLNETLLVAALSERANTSQRLPTTAEADRFIAENPTMFAQRTRFTLNQVQFPTPADTSVLRELESARTLDEIRATLARLGITYTSNPASLDSAALNPNVMRQIAGLPPGTPFMVPAGGTVYVSVVTGRQPVAGTAAENRKLAIDAIRRQRVNDSLQGQLKRLRDSAEIEYQQGFAPQQPKGTTKS